MTRGNAARFVEIARKGLEPDLLRPHYDVIILDAPPLLP